MHFCPELVGHMAIEQEFFLCRQEPEVVEVPESSAFLDAVAPEDPEDRWTYELSACQVEFRTQPCPDARMLREDLLSGKNQGGRIAKSLGLGLFAKEVARADMPLDVYPSDRYLRIARTIPRDMLHAACRVASVQIHYGCRDIKHAIDVHRALTRHLDTLSAMGDGSHGERLRLYKRMASHWQPPHYESAAHVESVAREEGWADNPKDCWHLIRISRHGTIELRCFGNTDDIHAVMSWVKSVRDIIGP
jgi:gamma-glutamyl:cysteine ligase YbdK (ATP-grasp superfamily)